MKLDEARKCYPNEWIAFSTTQDGDNPEGEVVLHSRDRHTFDEQVLARRLTDIYITFTGPTVPEKYAVMF